MSLRPGASRCLWALTSLTRWTTSKSRARPEIPQAFRDGVTARQMVFSVRLKSATTKLVVRGSRPRSTHSTETSQKIKELRK